MKIIVTDLTRFNNQDVCIAGICPDTGACIRPLPYLSKAECRERNILPGEILAGQFTPSRCSRPHVEDHSWKNRDFCGPCSSATFRNILAESATESVEDGFSVRIPRGQKYIPTETPPNTSIITLRIDPRGWQILRDRYNKVKVHLRENSGREFQYVPITDLGLYEYVMSHVADDGALGRLNDFLCSQREVFIRVGLGREYRVPDRGRGFWIQVNGIYTFPECFKDIRCHWRG
ncbi:hypothetical protein [Anaerobaca lacustris]|uniref:Uncharacterized protein n=1 Tax=Anaerobaca lacustris TaxID=3044600 RepID=A0AAW6U3T8_9BACT|nr:hypothetical protein [Sedimentisphaerales bacterium M17dextr]